MTTHTPAPWTWDKWNEGVALCANGQRIMGVIENMRRDYPSEANARLIAAAPDLLAALQGALVLLERLAPDTDRKLVGGSECSIGHYASYHVETARAAIARATNT